MDTIQAHFCLIELANGWHEQHLRRSTFLLEEARKRKFHSIMIQLVHKTLFPQQVAYYGLGLDATKTCSEPKAITSGSSTKSRSSIYRPNKSSTQMELRKMLFEGLDKRAKQGLRLSAKLHQDTSLDSSKQRTVTANVNIHITASVLMYNHHVTWRNRLLRGRNEGMTGARLELRGNGRDNSSVCRDAAFFVEKWSEWSKGSKEPGGSVFERACTSTQFPTYF